MAKILVIDDDPLICLTVEKVLRRDGHEVMTASGGREGLEQAKQLQPALIICDWNMPGIDGLEVCRQLKSEPRLNTTFFILLTARMAIQDRIDGLNNGADDFLSKPVDLGELKARVGAGLRLHQLNQDLRLQKQRLEDELSEAAAYVRSLLPVPMQGEVAVEARFIPSSQLGGDCFDYFWLDANHLVLYLLDVSGHGLGAALPSVILLNRLRSQSLPEVDFRQPDAVLTALNQSFQMDSQNQKFFTIWYGVYQPHSRQLTYASAGHPPAVLLTQTSEAPQLLRTPNFPIGMVEELEVYCSTTTVPAHSTLYLYSDGAYDVQHASLAWGLEDFIRLLAEAQPQTDLDQLLDRLFAQFEDRSLSDDLALVRANFK
ncbi:PP2C family protein-serine/threonine phosphatase [Leptolyngbya ohadii]|uniref:PP2C family protein-serine/threonine phosphatase n=1 Tax=Leptolyngbya ohadii TaxID=1962290 RepID=UPI000B59FAB2|nr:SpoIIE family protein phosphatase [Leptolyngbya ohadii]